MRNSMKLAAVSAGMIFLCSRPIGANAADVMYAASFCKAPVDFQDVIDYNFFGVHNLSADPAVVECPFVIPFSGALIVKEVDVTVYDRHPSANVSCTVRGIAIDGKVAWTGTKASSGSGASAQFLVFKPNKATLGTLHMSCSIPGNNPSLGVSHVTTYRLITSP